jgi:hypothetical protein
MDEETSGKPVSERDPATLTLEELSRMMGVRSELPQRRIAEGQFALRQIKAQLEATEAQKAAAKAEEIAAMASVEGTRVARRNANYLLASVFVAAISAIASAVSAYYAYWSAVHPLAK